MTQTTTIETAQEPQYETPTFSPSGAFATTLRSAEMARKGRPVQQEPAAGRPRAPAGQRRRAALRDPHVQPPRRVRHDAALGRDRPPRAASSQLDVLAYAA